MELRQRKRIANMPRFDIGADARNMALNDMGHNAIGIDAKAGYAAPSAPTLQQKAEQIWGEIGTAPLGAVKPGSGSTNPSFNLGQSIDSIKPDYKQIAIQIADGVGDTLSQKSKFSDSASNGVRNVGGAIAKIIPGKYGKLAQGAVEATANTIGMYGYHHSGAEQMSEAGTSESQIGGTQYTTQNMIDTNNSYSDVKNTGIKNAVSTSLKTSSAGLAIGGPVGAIVGGILGLGAGIFGGRHAMIRQKRINRNAVAQTAQINQQQESYADSQNLYDRYYQRNRDTTDGLLLANSGKDLRRRKRINNTKVC